MTSQPAAGDRSAALRRVILATVFVTYALIIIGGIVRATGSGDACPDWPRCKGELIPPFERDVLIEFTHRLVASVVGFLVAATAFVAVRRHRDVPVVCWGGIAAAGLVIAQIVLGGATVLNELPASMVMAHLALATALFALLIVIAVAATETSRRATNASVRNTALVAALATFLLMMTGSYVSGSGAGLAIRDWPLLNGGLLPDGGRLVMIHAMHRLAAALVGVFLLYAAWRAWRSDAPAAVVAGMTAAVALYGAQVLVGAAQVWTLLQPAAVAAHLALAVGLLGVLVATAAVAHGDLRSIGVLRRAARDAPQRAKTTVVAGEPS